MILLKQVVWLGLILISSSCSYAGHSHWKPIQDIAQYAVVQIINHTLEVDELVPFRRGSSESRGSGFVLHGGYVVTNFHVVKNAIRIFMQMPLLFGHQRFELELVGIAPDSDIALLYIKESDQEAIVAKHGSMPSLLLGNSDDIRRSDELLGIGFPLGQTSPKSATGIVSGDEKIVIPPSRIYAVQVTKPSNPGNSGGPILNSDGQVVAIDVAGPMGNTDNIAYAIPINELKNKLEDLKMGKVVNQTYFGGAFCHAKSNELAQVLGNPVPAGCYITRIFPGGLLADWDIRPADMLYAVNGLVIDPYCNVEYAAGRDRKPLVDYLLGLPLGSTVRLVLYRSGEKIEKDVQLLFKEEPAIRWHYVDYAVDYEIIGGILIQELSLNIVQALSKTPFSVQIKAAVYQNDEQKRQQQVLIVTQVLAGSLAAQSRAIGVGEFIAEINGMPVKNLEEVRAALAATSGEFITIKNDDGDLVALNMTDLYHQESQIAAYFGYQITPGIKALLQQ